ncbi:MAG TPA: hypothetical protein VFC38_08895 [Stellaceae bacterium]|nr:hypothetical protein [Stellaceae bacterium]
MGERAGGPRVAALIGPYLSGTFTHRFDRLQELTGKLAEKVLAARTGEAAQ